jgi:hypothetical protein
MTVTKIATRPVIVTSDAKAAKSAAPKAFAFKGRNASLRTVALAGVATCAYVEGKSRADVIAQLRIALGKSPTPPELLAAKIEYVVGRVAQKIGDSKMSIADQLDFARKLVTQYAAPSKDGVKSKLGKKLGYRTPAQHSAIRAAEVAFYAVNGELGFGTGQTQKEKNEKQTRGTKARKESKAPTHSELVAGPKLATSPADACAMIQTLSASLLAYANKNAAMLPTEYGLSIKRFHGAIAELEKGRTSRVI